MTKLEILTALKEARVVYSEALQNKDLDYSYCTEKGIESGMCFFFHCRDRIIKRVIRYYFDYKCNSFYIMIELEKDLIVKKQIDHYWYEPISILDGLITKNIIKNSLQPRLDHLNRTIARLENELQLNN